MVTLQGSNCPPNKEARAFFPSEQQRAATAWGSNCCGASGILGKTSFSPINPGYIGGCSSLNRVIPQTLAGVQEVLRKNLWVWGGEGLRT